MQTDYQAFLASKRLVAPTVGVDVQPEKLHPALFPFQRDLVRWALRKGRAAIFADTGLGKTLMSLSYAQHAAERVLILAPLAVAQQTVREGARWGIEVTYARSMEAAPERGITITNYEMLSHFDPAAFGAVVLDESAILKCFNGKTRTALIEAFRRTPMRLCCTATPAPNDIQEIANHAEFLGVMSRVEMLAHFFVHDSEGWRLKGHARRGFFRWLASWGMAVKRPSDLGYGDDGYELPALTVTPHFIETDYRPSDRLFDVGLKGITDRAQVRRGTLNARVELAAALVRAEPWEAWLCWVGLNDEGQELARLLTDATLVEGSQSPDEKAAALLGFADGTVPTLITKSGISGHGMNWQHCARMVFVGLSDCYDEKTEVLTRRGWQSFGDISTEDELATVNPNSLGLEWQTPSRIVWEPYSGPMLHFSGQRNFDLMVTPNHKLFVQRCPIRFPNGCSDWQLRYAEEIAARYRRSEYRMMSAPRSAEGSRPADIEIPAHGRINSRSRTVERIPADDFMRLAGWYLSEGHCRPIGSLEAGRIVICQSEQNAAHREEIIALLKQIGLNVNSNTKDITAYSINLAVFLIEQFGSGANGKRIPRWVKDLHPSLLATLRDTMLKGDGCHRKGVPHSYRTTSAELADDFQEICLLTGIRGSVHYRSSVGSIRHSDKGIYDIQLSWERLTPSIHRPPERVKYEGMIGCATVPNHTLIVRRNGIPVVSGNSWEAYYQSIRRCWRFGQTRPVHVHVILSDRERDIWNNVQRKEAEAEWLSRELIANAAEFAKSELAAITAAEEYRAAVQMSVPEWLKGGC
jgi:hypothetical protein